MGPADSAYKRKYIESTDNPHKQSPLLPHPHPTNVLLLNPLTMLVAGLRMPQMVTLRVVKVGDTQAPSYQVTHPTIHPIIATPQFTQLLPPHNSPNYPHPTIHPIIPIPQFTQSPPKTTQSPLTTHSHKPPHNHPTGG